MAIRNIVTEGDEILTKVCRPVEKFDGKLGQLLDDMYETMQEANGVGLAAPQVGIRRRIVVIDVGEGPIELMNPEILRESEEMDEDTEGCLSFPGKYGLVKRPRSVTVRAQDRDGNLFELEGEGLLARAFCHEIDHLDGVLFITRVSRMLSQEELIEILSKREREEDE
ncbi:peptide deformylase [Yeguia hominis]|uniref:Peptide deformylase n=1 Tax=Yeguia hominis TaxID=2763662 RepID=A0A926D5X0_9FIRM|nr:peptide deformylase [Yeguia hominis]MBC8533005.1 peptide deformylase [Yeguia hominis]